MNNKKNEFKTILLFFLSIFLITATGCSDDDSTPATEVIANFSTNTTTISESGSIQFSDESTGVPVEWNWSFEGGTPSTSNEQNPEVVYEKPGVYSVELSVSNGSTTNIIAEERLINVTCSGIYCEPVFSTYTKTSDIIYGLDANGHKMIIYEADGDSRTNRPIVALMGGGGFEGTNLDLLEPIAINLVKHGVVVALLEYRVIDTEDGTTELISAQQDCRTAVRYLKKEAVNLSIDPDQIFIGGNGSGAFAALFHAYIDESDLSSAELNVINGIGGLEGENQGNDGFSSEVVGIVSLAGGMYNTLDPITDQDVPIYAIHGTVDTEVPYNSEGTNPVTHGSKSITDKVSSVGLTSHLFTIENGSHTSPRQSSNDYILELMYFIRDIVQ